MSTIKVPVQRLQADFAPSGGSGKERRKRVTWYTGATVLRNSWDEGPFKLTLGMKPENVRMERFKSGKAPVLDSHWDFALNSILGVVEDASIEDGKGIADLKFSDRPDVDNIWNDIQNGIIRNASVGARIHRMLETTAEEDKIKSYLAVDWEPLEISIVAIGADPNAGFKDGAGVRFTEAEIVSADIQGAIVARKEGEPMDPKDKSPVAGSVETRTQADQGLAAAAVADPPVDETKLRAEAVTQERKRVDGIIGIAALKSLSLPPTFATDHIKLGTSVSDFHKLAIDETAKAEARQPRQEGQIRVITAEADTLRAGLALALHHRMDPAKYPILGTAGEQYAHLKLLDIAKECLDANGIRHRGKNASDIAKLAFESTSDFPYILANVLNKNLRAAYDIADALSKWKDISARRTAPDFKTMSELQLDSNTRLAALPESGEYKHGALVEGGETWYLKTYGQIIAITRQVIINDDLAAFSTIPMYMGREVAVLEATTVWGIITANAALADGVALFYATTHVNLDSAAAISITSLGTGIALMMKQTTIGGMVMNIAPKFLVVPVALLGIARQYCSPSYTPAVAGAMFPSSAANVNPWAGSMTPIAEARLDTASATAWYLFADPNVAPVVIHAYLEGQEGPYTETRQGFDVDGVEIKIRHDFAAAAIDFRGATKNAGA
jgi:hypothetical protein